MNGNRFSSLSPSKRFFLASSVELKFGPWLLCSRKLVWLLAGVVACAVCVVVADVKEGKPNRAVRWQERDDDDDWHWVSKLETKPDWSKWKCFVQWVATFEMEWLIPHHMSLSRRALLTWSVFHTQKKPLSSSTTTKSYCQKKRLAADRDFCCWSLYQ